MAQGSAPSALAASVLLCCVATSALTTLLIHFYLHSGLNRSDSSSPSQKPAAKSTSGKVPESGQSDVSPLPVNGSAHNRPVLDLQSLENATVPVALQLDAYFSPERLRDFDHARLFDGCSNVLAVLDAIHPYLVKFFADNAWLSTSGAENAQITTLQSSTRLDSDGRALAEEESDSEDSDDPRRGRSSSYPRIKTRWRLPEWLDPNETAEIVIYPGVRTHTFAPQKIINLEEEGQGRTARRPSTESTGSARRPTYGWSRSAVSQEEEEEVEKRRLIVLPDAHVLGGTFDLSEGSIHIGKHVRIEPDVYIKGPAIIGARSTLRSGTYIRGDVVVGRNVVLRGEIKNSVILDDAELCHPGYCGDSVCGFKSHFGNQVTTANLSLFSGSSLTIDVDGVTYDTGRRKAGVILGDGSQLGCSSVTDPCTLIQQNTVVYPLTRLRKGVYGPSLLIKNKPMEKGVLEIVPIRPSEQ
ncbi:Bifunctional GlmU protein [Phytophthora cinnamomi]|uniref:Bifunctional GlmU protein n=1 Tax=Phytophthora cinnamomi TaxID=4785 RepID=UPI00355A3179|nr:Bifunctional GlmU protein [Phytophthora cinnamomi]